MPRIDQLRSDHVHIPVDSRHMVFVDGEGISIRGRKLADEYHLNISEGENYQRDVFLWPMESHPSALFNGFTKIKGPATRSHFYTSVAGDDQKLEQVKDYLWNLGFHPEVFKKPSQATKSKGVDITLTKDMLAHAYADNYDVAILVAGDGDFVPVVDEIKRMGKIVCVSFIESINCLSPKLVRSADYFFPLDIHLRDRLFDWTELNGNLDGLLKWIDFLNRNISGGFIAGHVNEAYLRIAELLNFGFHPQRFRTVVDVPVNDPNLKTMLDKCGILTNTTPGFAFNEGVYLRNAHAGNLLAAAELMIQAQYYQDMNWYGQRFIPLIKESFRYGYENVPLVKSWKKRAEEVVEILRRG